MENNDLLLDQLTSWREKNVLLCVKIDELLDILHEIHSAIGHGRRNFIMSELKIKDCSIINEIVMVY